MPTPEYLDPTTPAVLQLLSEIPDDIRTQLVLVGGLRVCSLLDGTPKWRTKPDIDLVVPQDTSPKRVAETVREQNAAFSARPKYVAWDSVYVLTHSLGEIELVGLADRGSYTVDVLRGVDLVTDSSTVVNLGDPPIRTRVAALGPTILGKIYGDNLHNVAQRMQRGGEFWHYAESGLSKDFFDAMALVDKFGAEAILKNVRDAHATSNVPGFDASLSKLSGGCRWATEYVDDVFTIAGKDGLAIPDQTNFLTAMESLAAATERFKLLRAEEAATAFELSQVAHAARTASAPDPSPSF